MELLRTIRADRLRRSAANGQQQTQASSQDNSSQSRGSTRAVARSSSTTVSLSSSTCDSSALRRTHTQPAVLQQSSNHQLSSQLEDIIERTCTRYYRACTRITDNQFLHSSTVSELLPLMQEFGSASMMMILRHRMLHTEAEDEVKTDTQSTAASSVIELLSTVVECAERVAPKPSKVAVRPSLAPVTRRQTRQATADSLAQQQRVLKQRRTNAQVADEKMAESESDAVIQSDEEEEEKEAEYDDIHSGVSDSDSSVVSLDILDTFVDDAHSATATGTTTTQPLTSSSSLQPASRSSSTTSSSSSAVPASAQSLRLTAPAAAPSARHFFNNNAHRQAVPRLQRAAWAQSATAPTATNNTAAPSANAVTSSSSTASTGPRVTVASRFAPTASVSATPQSFSTNSTLTRTSSRQTSLPFINSREGKLTLSSWRKLDNAGSLWRKGLVQATTAATTTQVIQQQIHHIITGDDDGPATAPPADVSARATSASDVLAHKSSTRRAISRSLQRAAAPVASLPGLSGTQSSDHLTTAALRLDIRERLTHTNPTQLVQLMLITKYRDAVLVALEHLASDIDALLHTAIPDSAVHAAIDQLVKPSTTAAKQSDKTQATSDLYKPLRLAYQQLIAGVASACGEVLGMFDATVPAVIATRIQPRFASLIDHQLISQGDRRQFVTYIFEADRQQLVLVRNHLLGVTSARPAASTEVMVSTSSSSAAAATSSDSNALHRIVQTNSVWQMVLNYIGVEETFSSLVHVCRLWFRQCLELAMIQPTVRLQRLPPPSFMAVMMAKSQLRYIHVSAIRKVTTVRTEATSAPAAPSPVKQAAKPPPSPTAIELMARYCPTMEGFSMRYTLMWQPEVTALLTHCRNLRQLECQFTASDESQCWPLLGQFPNLQALTIINSKATEASIRKFTTLNHPHSQLLLLTLHSSAIGLRALQLLLQNCHRLRNLTVTQTQSSELAIMDVIQLLYSNDVSQYDGRALALQSLCLMLRYPVQARQGLPQHFQMADLPHHAQMAAAHAEALGIDHPLVRRNSSSAGVFKASKASELVNHAPHLRALCLSSVKQQSGATLSKFTSFAAACTQLVDLRLLFPYQNMIEGELIDFERVTANNQQLQVLQLNLAAMPRQLYQNTLQHCANVQCLSLVGRLEPRQLQQIADHCSQLQRLTLSDSMTVSPNKPADTTQSPAIKVEDIDQREVALCSILHQRGHGLTYLSLQGITVIDTTLDTIATCCPGLIYLAITYLAPYRKAADAVMFSGTGLHAVLNHCTALEWLDLSDCESINDTEISKTLRSAGNYGLRALILKNTSVDASMLPNVLRRCPSLSLLVDAAGTAYLSPHQTYPPPRFSYEATDYCGAQPPAVPVMSGVYAAQFGPSMSTSAALSTGS